MAHEAATVTSAPPPGETARLSFHETSNIKTDYRTVWARCGNSIAVNVVVVELRELQFRFDEPDRPNADAWFQRVPPKTSLHAGATLLFRAVKTPEGAAWPAGMPTWGGVPGGQVNENTRRVTFAASKTLQDFKSVTASCGSTLRFDPLVVRVARLQYRIEQPGAENSKAPFTDVPRGPLPVPCGTSIAFNALSEPQGAAWPYWGSAWGGTVKPRDEGQFARAYFNEVSTSLTDYKTVEAGKDRPLVAKVLVYSSRLLVKRRGQPEQAYGPSADIAAGAINSREHYADVLLQLTPPIPNLKVPAVKFMPWGYEKGFRPGMGDGVLKLGTVTDSKGQIRGTYRSSEQVGGVGLEHRFESWDGGRASISQEWDDIGFDYPDADNPNIPLLWEHDRFFRPDRPVKIVFKPKFTDEDGSYHAITGHRVHFYAKSATVLKWNGVDDWEAATYTADTLGQIVSARPAAAVLATFDSPQPKGDSGHGTYVSHLLVQPEPDWHELMYDIAYEVLDTTTSRIDEYTGVLPE